MPHLEQRSDINKRLNECVAVDTFRASSNAKEGMISLIIRTLIFIHLRMEKYGSARLQEYQAALRYGAWQILTSVCKQERRLAEKLLIRNVANKTPAS